MRRAGFLVLALSVVIVTGCSRGRGGPPPQSPPSQPAPPEPKAEPPKPEPEPEPLPGEPVRLTIPEDGGKWPWGVGQAAEPGQSRPVALTGVGPLAVTGFAVCPEANRAVVSIQVDKAEKGKKGQVVTRVALCDTAAGVIVSEWQLPGLHAVTDLSPDGRQILAMHPTSGKERATLRMWMVGSDGQLKRWTWTPHTPPRSEGLRVEAGVRLDAASSVEVSWAGFVGNDRVVSSSRAGQLRVFDTDGLKPLASIDASPGRPAVTPDGTRVAFLVGSSVALLDPATAKVIGTRWLGTPPPHAALAFSPDGSKLAVGGNGKLAILDLATGDVRQVSLARMRVNDGGLADKPFGWAGPGHLFADTQLYDLQVPGAAWEYIGAEHVRFSGSQLWASVKPASGSPATIRSYTLPHPQALERIAAVAERPGLFALQPGSTIQVDATGIPLERRSVVKGALEARLMEIGYIPGSTGTATLFASVDTTGKKATTTYARLDAITYTKRPARLLLETDGKELWSEAWAVEPPFFARPPVGTSFGEYFRKLSVGEPNERLFTSAPLPDHFPGPQAPSAPLGTTVLTAGGFKETGPR
jgi:hypothetical protein